jgi:acylphosphatase
MPCARFHIHGRVQGVFYRDWCVQTAQALGLHGWVRNRAEGSVEVLAAGSADALDRFETLCRQGPPRAQVDTIERVAEEELPPPGFTRRPTA